MTKHLSHFVIAMLVSTALNATLQTIDPAQAVSPTGAQLSPMIQAVFTFLFSPLLFDLSPIAAFAFGIITFASTISWRSHRNIAEHFLVLLYGGILFGLVLGAIASAITQFTIVRGSPHVLIPILDWWVIVTLAITLIAAIFLGIANLILIKVVNKKDAKA